ncbi:hypothetical protein WJX74_005690 [Apatococcus lobatus]|uniref:F-box domain-containing protein n=1 Tax=Apatococcus lobatus TaxID=904363 RepID=A0AAW1SCB8_9CHLO
MRKVKLQGLKMLPAEILAKIMSYLDQRDLLRMRQASRRFSSLAHMQELQLRWKVASEDDSASLSLFALRHCMGPEDSAPSLAITIGLGVEKDFPVEVDFCWPSLIQALNCSRLTAIRCESWDLTQLQAQYLMRAIPSELTILGLQTSPVILEDPNWQRLSMLTQLIYNSRIGEAATSSVPAWGIAQLPLKTFSHRSIHEQGRQVFADGFQLPPVEILRLNGDPFSSKENAVSVNILQEVQLCSPSQHLISKYTGVNLQRLHLCAGGCPTTTRSLLEELARCAPEVACRHLTFGGMRSYTNTVGRSMDLFKVVNAMPRLSTLALQRSVCVHACADVHASANLHCPSPRDGSTTLCTSLASYTAVLKRVTVRIQGAFQLKLQNSSGLETQSADLQPNGHVVMCMCRTCCPDA